MAAQFWQRTGFWGFILSSGFFLLIHNHSLTGIDPYLYQLAMGLAPRPASKELVLVEVNAAVTPELHRKILAKIQQANPRWLVDTLPLNQSQTMQGQAEFKQLFDYYEASYLVNGGYGRTAEDKKRLNEIQQMGQYLAQLKTIFDSDQQLAQQMRKQVHVILAATAQTQKNIGLLADLPPSLQAMQLPIFIPQWQQRQLQSLSDIQPPLPLFAQAANSIGILPAPRLHQRIPLVLAYQQHYLPHLSLLVAARVKNLDLHHISPSLSANTALRLGDTLLYTDEGLNLQSFHYVSQKNLAPFVTFTHQKLLTQNDVSALSDKVVLLGFTPQTSDFWAKKRQPLSSLADNISTLLQGHIIHRPRWAGGIEMAIFIVVSGYLIFLLPLLRGTLAFGITLLLSLVILATQILLLAVDLIGLSLSPLVMLLWLGQLLFAVKNFWISPSLTHNGTLARNQRLMGLTFQSQGDLQKAFDTFMQCPIDDLILSLLYNLGLDFERKQQPKQALAVYRYMLNHAANFRDINQRIDRLSKQSPLLYQTQEDILGHYLGHYLVLRELGKGAMGRVYLGKDPKLNRIVALKTLKLSLEFEGRELEEATARFFREASAVGRLNHPNIVSVYDAGEQGDLAYIAMDYFAGGDLSLYVQGQKNVLPLETLLGLAIKVANALDYAHSQGVIHRDIKPANILYNAAIGDIKITDFGIARITDSNKTRTGVVLGTPSYMSPEQLESKGVDGRSDLFSFGVTLYQLISHQLPFNADSMASLMFKIIHENPPDLLELSPSLPLGIKTIVDTLLQKNPNLRYPSGFALAQALQACVEQVQAMNLPINRFENRVR